MDFKLLDFAVSRQVPDINGGLPHEMPRSGQVVLTDAVNFFWIVAANLPAESLWEVVFERPDGTVAYNSGPQPFGNANRQQWSWWWLWHDIEDMHSISGRWQLDIHLPGAIFDFDTTNLYGDWEIKLISENSSQLLPYSADANTQGWSSLGVFELPAGKVSLELSNQTSGRLVIADAVRWSPID